MSRRTGPVPTGTCITLLEIRQNIANIGVFVMKQTIDMQINPDPAKLKPLIEINCNLAAGLSGKA